MRQRGRLVVMAIGLSFPSLAADEKAPPPSLSQEMGRIPELQEYRKALATVLANKKKVSLESLYSKANAAVEAIDRYSDPHNHSDDEYKSYRPEHPGLELEPCGEGGVHNLVDVDYFKRLADERGTPVDRDFFGALAKTGAGGPHQEYSFSRQASWAGACYEFGKGRFIDFYKTWLAFERRHPNDYRETVKRMLGVVPNALDQSLCVCNSKLEDVTGELHQLAKEFPGSPVETAANNALLAIGNGEDRVHLNCVPG